MTDPLRPLGQTPRRAPPLQPDKPGGGDSPDDSNSKDEVEQELAKATEQSATAVSNVRDGYK